VDWLDFELSVLELLDVAVLVSEPQPDSTTASGCGQTSPLASGEDICAPVKQD
jgi:hypothetical protein